MKFSRILMFVAICASLSMAAPKADQMLAAKDAELKQIRSQIEVARDSLQRLIAKQYGFKQKVVEQREIDKEEVDRLREQQEKMSNELARIKEERLSREQSLEDDRKALVGKQEEWASVKEQLKDIFQKESDGLLETFPLDKEIRRGDVEKIKSILSANSAPAVSFSAFVDYRLKWFARGDSLSIEKAVLMPEESGPVEMTIARFGSMFGYGLDETGACYYLRQTGRLGNEKYAVEKIGALELNTKLASRLSGWITAGAVSGMVPLEMMQNDQTRMLISGKKQSYWTELYHSIKQGGMVMIPLLLLPFWVLWIVIAKILQFSAASRRMKQQFADVKKFIDKSDFDGALAYAKQGKRGLVAHIAQLCIERRAQGRDAGERVAYEYLGLEAPSLNRNLNTLAVIAGAAPLIGLLGTISGMITLFAAVTQFGTGDPKFLAGGISEALITAKTGLAVAIPVLFIHDLLRGAKDRLVASMEKHAVDMLNALYPEE